MSRGPLVSSEIEDRAIIAPKIYTPAELTFDVGWRLPARVARDRVPDPNRPFGLRVTPARTPSKFGAITCIIDHNPDPKAKVFHLAQGHRVRWPARYGVEGACL